MCFRFGLCSRSPRQDRDGVGVISQGPSAHDAGHSSGRMRSPPSLTLDACALSLQLTPPPVMPGAAHDVLFGTSQTINGGGAPTAARQEELLQQVERYKAENIELRALLAAQTRSSCHTSNHQKAANAKYMYNYVETDRSSKTARSSSQRASTGALHSEAQWAFGPSTGQGLDSSAPGAVLLRTCQLAQTSQGDADKGCQDLPPCISLAALNSAAGRLDAHTALLLFQYDDAAGVASTRTSFLDTPMAAPQRTNSLLRSTTSQFIAKASGLPSVNGGNQPPAGGPVVNVQCMWLSAGYMTSLAANNEAAGRDLVDDYINSHQMANRMVEGLCRNLVQGRQGMAVHWWEGGAQATGGLGLQRISLWPCQVVVDDDDQEDCTQPALFSAALLCLEPILACPGALHGVIQHYMAAALAPCMITVVDASGHIQLQNPESCAKLGCHAPSSSTDYSVLLRTDSLGSLGGVRRPSGATLSSEPTAKLNYMKELFIDQGEQLAAMQETLCAQQQFEGRVRIASPLLRNWLGLAGDEELWYHTQVTRATSPTGQDVFYITQIEITDVMEAERQVAALQNQQTALLQEILPSQVIHHLLTFKDSSSLPTTPTKQQAFSAVEPAVVPAAALDPATPGTSSDFLDSRPRESPLEPMRLPEQPQVKGNQLSSRSQVQVTDRMIRCPPRKQDTGQFLYSSSSGHPRQGSGLTALDPGSNMSGIFSDCLDVSSHTLAKLDALADIPKVAPSHCTQSSPLEIASASRAQAAPGLSVAEDARGSADAVNQLSLDVLLKAIFPHSNLRNPGFRRPSRSSSQRAIHVSSRRNSVADCSPAQHTPQALTRATTPTPSHPQLGRASPSSSLHEQSHTSCTSLNLEGSVTQGGKFRSSAFITPAASFDQQCESQQLAPTVKLATGPAAVGTHLTSPALDQDSSGCRVWLTQADVMSLATYHDHVSILFADIKGFTSMSNQLHPSKVMLFLNRLYSVWDSLLATFGVYKVETIGDSYMAATGLFCVDPATGKQSLGGVDPEHATKMMKFAQAMLLSSQSVETPLGQSVQVRIGIHSGSCSSGVVGQRMPRFCLFGDSVNTASRMESTGFPGCIHASNAFYVMNKQLPWEPTGGVMVKGKGMMNTWLLPVLPMGFTALEELHAERAAAASKPPASPIASPTVCLQDLPPAQSTSHALVQARSLPVGTETASAADRLHGSNADDINHLQDLLHQSMSATSTLPRINSGHLAGTNMRPGEETAVQRVWEAGSQVADVYTCAASAASVDTQVHLCWQATHPGLNSPATQPNQLQLVTDGCIKVGCGAFAALENRIHATDSSYTFQSAHEHESHESRDQSGSLTLNNLVQDNHSSVSAPSHLGATGYVVATSLAHKPEDFGMSGPSLVFDLNDEHHPSRLSISKPLQRTRLPTIELRESLHTSLNPESSGLGSQQKDLITNMTSHVLQRLQESRPASVALDEPSIPGSPAWADCSEGQKSEESSARSSRRRASVHSSGNNAFMRTRHIKSTVRGSLELGSSAGTGGSLVITGRQSLDRPSKDVNSGSWWLSVGRARISTEQACTHGSDGVCHTARPDLQHHTVDDETRIIMQQTWPKTVHNFQWM